MLNNSRLLSLLVLLLLPGWVLAQEERTTIKSNLVTKEASPGETITLKVLFELKPGYHTYPVKQTDPNAADFVTHFRIKTGPVEIGTIKEPKPHEKVDPDLKATIGIFEEPTEFELPIKIKPDAPAGKVKFSVRVQTQICNDSNCLPFNETLEYEITVKSGGKPAGEPPPRAPVATRAMVSSSAPVPTPPQAVEPSKASKEKNASEVPAATLGAFLWQAVFWGFISLLTPCVFPMIPITVSYFLKQKQEGKQSLVHALVYTFTIIIALSIFTLFFVEVAQKLIYHWGTNLFLGLLLGFFALSLFGMFEITLPSFLTRLTSSGESKGGYLGTFFMALTFILISFSCVAPFVGGFAGVSAQERPTVWNVLGAITFASCFAAPFFLLSLFPSMLKKLPKSGGWMNSLKVILGILEVAAALKFLRQSELNFKGNNPDYLTYDVVMSLYIGMCVVAGLYLFKVFRMPHDHEEGNSHVGVGRFLWGCLFMSLGIYLTPSLFRGPDGYKIRPAGEVFSWVDSFLLQGDDTKPIQLAGLGGNHQAELKWFGFLKEALADAKLKNRRIFVDFTGINCQNCTKNEKTIFILPDVKQAFEKYTLLKLYTDTVPMEYYPLENLDATTVDIQEKDGEAHRIFEKERFDTTELPFYAVIEPDGNDFKIVGRYSVGLIRDKDEFLKFLREHAGKK